MANATQTLFLGQSTVMKGQRPGQLRSQHRVDTKALTGRGGPTPIQAAQLDVDSVVAQMAALVRISHEVQGRQMFLVLHRRMATGQFSLRWRDGGNANRHVSWLRAATRIASYSTELKRWYIHLDAAARQANSEEIAARAKLRALHKLYGPGAL